MSTQRCWLWLIVPWQVACELVSGEVCALCLDSGIVSPLWLHCVMGVCMFEHNMPPALLAEWLGSFTCHCIKAGVEQTPNKSQHTKLTLEKKNLLLLLPGFKLANFQLWVQNSTKMLYQLPISKWHMDFVLCFLTFKNQNKKKRNKKDGSHSIFTSYENIDEQSSLGRQRSGDTLTLVSQCSDTLN